MIVDDNAMNIVAMQALIHSHGQETDKADGGLEGLELVKERFKRRRDTYKLMLIDYSMPTCNGPEATRRIRGFLQES